MNGKQAKQLALIAKRMSGGTRRSGTVSITHVEPLEKKKKGPLAQFFAYFKRKGIARPPSVTIRNTGYRATYRNLKRAFLAVPRPEREVWLAGAMDYTAAEVATGQIGG